jgi:hypothetical protein
MTVKLDEELRRALAAHPNEPVRLVDEQTGVVYVLLRADEYERTKEGLDDDIRDTYPAQMESAMRAGWGDPGMDVYDNYDENYRKLYGRDPR